jgi:hypothetical protein
MQYKKINNLLGWLCFAIASVSYILTLEPSVSFWDCGEFISCAFRLQVSHQPGYPLFAMIGKVFSLLSMGNNAKVAYFTNIGCALASGATVMFLFWTITALAKKLLFTKGAELQSSQVIRVMGAGLVGALAFAYTDTFWFSAVETIVFAQSMLCISIVFWAILKWEAHADEPRADKWLIFIAYVIGLSIGIHLMSLLAIPAIIMVYYFKRFKNISIKNNVIAFAAGIGTLLFIQYGIIQDTVKVTGYFELFFVNTLGLGFGSGAIFFLILLITILVTGIVYSIRKGKPLLNLAFLCVAFIYLGYSSFTYIPIRASANTDLNNWHPDNAFTLVRYLNREQYTPSPLLYGPYFDAKITDATEGAGIYRKGKTNYEVLGKKQELTYDHNTILPRIFSNDAQDQEPQFYKDWLQLADNQTPTFKDNLNFMFSWQIYQMYFRYFLWNFVGRYNQMDGQASMTGVDGNWTSGLFDGGKHLPNSIMKDNTYTPLYALPLIIGLLGMFYHFKRNRRDAAVIGLLWFFTGLAIILYVNQPGIQPRERDYSYVGSFYAFAIWIGFGVIALADLITKKLNAKNSAIIASAICLLAAPVLLANKEWKAHDRSTKLVAHDMAYNYLMSCPPNAILFNSADNDTYSLWYDQEVEGIRPDVRLVNLNLFGADWNIRQMQGKINQADALPITMPFDKYKEGVRDMISFNDAKLPGSVELKEVFDFITSDDSRTKLEYQNGTTENYLPTQNFKLTINAADVIKNGVVPVNDKSKIAASMEWKFPINYITKQNLALLDILAHNDWKRPLCFTATLGTLDFIGMQKYLYKEGFVYHLMPLKTDTAAKDGMGKINSIVMYNNMMNKFKWGNFKTAKYLDPESRMMFYPLILSSFIELTQNLINEHHPDMALKALNKYDQVMPDLNPHIDIVRNKYFLVDTAYKLRNMKLANKFANSIDRYVVDQLNYNYRVYQTNPADTDLHTVQVGLSVLNGIAELAKQNQQTALNTRLQAQVADYQHKFQRIMN